MTFQLEGDVPGYLGGENPIGFTSPTNRLQTVKPQKAFSIDPRESDESTYGRMKSNKFDFTHHVMNDDNTFYGEGSFNLQRPLKPHFPNKIKSRIQKLTRGPLKPTEMVELIEEICKISVDFFKIRDGKHIAVKIDGTVVESADSELDLLLKIQGRQFGVPVFVYEVGAESSLGW